MYLKSKRRDKIQMHISKYGKLLLITIAIISAINHTYAQAELGKDSTGRPVLMMNDIPTALIPGLWSGWADPKQTTVALTAFKKSGLTQVVFLANLGFYNSRYGYTTITNYMSEFWRGPKDYDKSVVDKVLSLPFKADPDSKIIIWLLIGEYPEFGIKYPEEVIRNDKGEKLIVSTHFLRFDSLPPKEAKEHYAISFFSEHYRQECKDMMTEFIKTVEASPYGKNVVGYLIGGGQDGQFYSWSPPNGRLEEKTDNWGDYSLPAQKAFIKWAEKKYGDVARLNKEWNANLTSFDQVTPPPASELAGVRPFHDPVKERKSYDWKRFLAEGRAELLETFAAHIKDAANKKVIVGVSGGDGGHRRDNTSTSRLIRSPYIDLYVHQAAYGVRIPPSVGGINALLDSYTANGKLFLTDMDHRLWTGKKIGTFSEGVISVPAASMGQAADMAMQRDMWRREYARLWVSGNNGAHFNNMGRSEQYDNAELQSEIRFLNDFSNKLVKQRCSSTLINRLMNYFANPDQDAASEVVFVFDEEAVDYARSELPQFHGSPMFLQWPETGASGVPMRFYYAQDLRDGIIPAAKLYILQNCLDIDVTLAQRIKDLRKAGATIVLLQGTGMVQLARGETGLLDDALGIRLRQLDAIEKNSKGKFEAGHPLLIGNEWNNKVASFNNENLKEVEGIALTVNESSASVLANYPVSGSPAVAAVVNNGSKVIFVGAYKLSRDAISRLASYAGAWRVSPPGNVIAADNQILMIHPLIDGKVEVNLKKEAVLTEMPPGSLISPKVLKHRLDLKAGHTYLFEQTTASGDQ